MSYKVKFFIGSEYKHAIKEMDENSLNEYWEKLNKANPGGSADFREFDTLAEKEAFLEGLRTASFGDWDLIYVL